MASIVSPSKTFFNKTNSMRKTSRKAVCAGDAKRIARYTTSSPFQSTPSAPQYHNQQVRDKLAEREFFLSVLGASATKRDAKAYLSRFNPVELPANPTTARIGRELKAVVGENHYDIWRLNKTGVNLGNLYARAIDESPVFTQQPLQEKLRPDALQDVHVAVVKLRSPQYLDDETLDGVGLTLSQLSRLGMTSAVVIDCDEEDTLEKPERLTKVWRDEVVQQADRLVKAIKSHKNGMAVVFAQAMTKKDLDEQVSSIVQVRGGVEVNQDSQLMATIRHGVIPVIPPIAYETEPPKAVRVQADDVVLALTREFAGLNQRTAKASDPVKMVDAIMDEVKEMQHSSKLDRIIVLDPLGGIPAPERSEKAHVFINLDQEYQEIRTDLLRPAPYLEISEDTPRSSLGASNLTLAKEYASIVSYEDGWDSHEGPTWNDPLDAEAVARQVKEIKRSNKLLEKEVAPQSSSSSLPQLSVSPSAAPNPSMARHIKNLDLIQHALALLPRESSALLTTPEEAASSARIGRSAGSTTGVRTRRQKNPLIHNLLTDKPVVSSSLPAARLKDEPTSRESGSSPLENRPPTTTFFKKGMPVTIIPDPRTHSWEPPGPEGTSLNLETDPRVDFPRLVHLIEDSFGRPLNVHHYLNRIRHKIAGIIIAGEYEGGAILTWEDPPHNLPAQEKRPPVPYLDKFAVLRRSQGSGGVADVVFKTMVRGCFPDGVVWRSRQNNPVNKWYFERATGTWKLPGAQWTMFWTGKGIELPSLKGVRETKLQDGEMEEVDEKRERWNDYVDVCGGIEASWADMHKKAPD